MGKEPQWLFKWPVKSLNFPELQRGPAGVQKGDLMGDSL